MDTVHVGQQFKTNQKMTILMLLGKFSVTRVVVCLICFDPAFMQRVKDSVLSG